MPFDVAGAGSGILPVLLRRSINLPLQYSELYYHACSVLLLSLKPKMFALKLVHLELGHRNYKSLSEQPEEPPTYTSRRLIKMLSIYYPSSL